MDSLHPTTAVGQAMKMGNSVDFVEVTPRGTRVTVTNEQGGTYFGWPSSNYSEEIRSDWVKGSHQDSYCGTPYILKGSSFSTIRWISLTFQGNSLPFVSLILNGSSTVEELYGLDIGEHPQGFTLHHSFVWPPPAKESAKPKDEACETKDKDDDKSSTVTGIYCINLASSTWLIGSSYFGPKGQLEISSKTLPLSIYACGGYLSREALHEINETKPMFHPLTDVLSPHLASHFLRLPVSRIMDVTDLRGLPFRPTSTVVFSPGTYSSILIESKFPYSFSWGEEEKPKWQVRYSLDLQAILCLEALAGAYGLCTLYTDFSPRISYRVSGKMSSGESFQYGFEERE